MDPLWILFIGIVVVMGGILALRLHAFLALVLGALVVATLTSDRKLVEFALKNKQSPEQAKALANQSPSERVAREFGSTCGKIGILIGMASIVGKCLLDSGGADRIVRGVLGVMGESRAPLAFLASGYLLGIPVFFDTVFLLMIPIGKAMRLRTGRNYLFYILTIIAGATMTHSLAPPTPGPLFVAAALNVNMGLMILGGCAVSAFTAIAGYSWAKWVNSRNDIPLRESPNTNLAELEQLARRDERDLPPFWLSLTPILLPVLLISGDTLLASLLKGPAPDQVATELKMLASWFHTLGDPNIALGISAAIALAMLAWQKRSSLSALGAATQDALGEAGLIILITAAGGAFGGVLQQSGIGPRIQELSSHYNIALLVLAFFVTALIRIAQGSATVAMITTVGMLGSMADPAQTGFHPLYLALAIGCGSKPVPWMNDSGFWVVCKMSGLTEREALKFYSPMVTLMGFVGLVVVMLLAKVFPMV